MSTNQEVNTQLTFSAGILSTGANRLDLTASTDGVSGYGTGKYVFGNFRRYVSSGIDYNLPIGTATNYELAGIRVSSHTGLSYIDVGFTISNENPPPAITVNGVAVNDFLDYGYWTFTPNVGLTAVQYNVTIQSTGHTDMGVSEDNYSLITDYGLGGGWQDLGLHSISTQQYSATTVLAKRQNLTTFGKYIIAHHTTTLYNPPAVTEELRVKGAIFKTQASSTTTVSGSSTALNNYNSGTVEIISGGTVTADGDVTNESGSSFQIDGQLNIKGNWTNNATASVALAGATTGTVEFQGSAAQTIGGTSSTIFEGLTVNNAAGVNLSTNQEVNTQLTFSGGKLITSSANLLTLNDNATSSAGSATSFVDGPMRKIGNDAFVFPLGDGTRWARLGITAPTTITTQYTAQYFANNPTTDGYNSASRIGLTNVSIIEYWTLDQAVNDDDVQVTLYWEDNDFSQILDCDGVPDDLRLAHWNGTAWEMNIDGVVLTGTCTGGSSGTMQSSASQPTYSPFTFGSKTGSNPLPIELLFFDAQMNGKVVDIFWSTSTEINNDYFTVERSPDAVVFSELAKVKGAGNSSQTLHYNAVDANPLSGISYYRLKQTDFDGNYTYSNIVAIEQSTDDILGINFSVFPNPSNGKFIGLRSNINYLPKTEIVIVVVDIFGRKLYSKVLFTDEKGAYFTAIDTYNNIPAGIYFVIGSSDNNVYHQKLIINQ